MLQEKCVSRQPRILDSIIVQRDATVYRFIIFLQTALCVSDNTLIHHQEHTQNCNYNTWHWSNRVCYCPLTWRVSSETRRAVCRNIIKLYIAASRWTIIDTDLRCTEPLKFTSLDVLQYLKDKILPHGVLKNCYISCLNTLFIYS